MGAAGRQRVKELFSWSAVAVRTAEVLEDVIAEYRGERNADR
jgi:glycosyltransferase involved in cell wall biosynthesis